MLKRNYPDEAWKKPTEVKPLKFLQGSYALCKSLYSLAFFFPKAFLNTKKGSAFLGTTVTYYTPF